MGGLDWLGWGVVVWRRSESNVGVVRTLRRERHCVGRQLVSSSEMSPEGKPIETTLPNILRNDHCLVSPLGLRYHLVHMNVRRWQQARWLAIDIYCYIIIPIDIWV